MTTSFQSPSQAKREKINQLFFVHKYPPTDPNYRTERFKAFIVPRDNPPYRRASDVIVLGAKIAHRDKHYHPH